MKINMKGRTNRQILDSPSPQQGVPELISGLTGLCVYVFPRIIDGAIIYSIYYIFFSHKKRAIIRGRLFDYFNQILLTGIRLLNISFYYLIESKYDHIK